MIILGLGTNLGDREENLHQATARIGENLLRDIRKSSIMETAALIHKNAPKDWDINFLNMAIAGELKVEITPLEFLTAIKNIETELGRKPAERWSPRMIDIDILAWRNEVLDLPELQIPHVGVSERDFVRLPLLEIAPDWVNPRTGQRL